MTQAFAAKALSNIKNNEQYKQQLCLKHISVQCSFLLVEGPAIFFSIGQVQQPCFSFGRKQSQCPFNFIGGQVLQSSFLLDRYNNLVFLLVENNQNFHLILLVARFYSLLSCWQGATVLFFHWCTRITELIPIGGKSLHSPILLVDIG
jgi:hypothetical protein